MPHVRVEAGRQRGRFGRLPDARRRRRLALRSGPFRRDPLAHYAGPARARKPRQPRARGGGGRAARRPSRYGSRGRRRDRRLVPGAGRRAARRGRGAGRPCALHRGERLRDARRRQPHGRQRERRRVRRRSRAAHALRYDAGRARRRAAAEHRGGPRRALPRQAAGLPGNPVNTIEEILAELAAGRMVVVMDDEERENEGDLLMAAACVRPEDINFMARHGRGLICLTLTEERCRALRLPLMVREAEDRHGTNFTVSIEAARGVTTGISAQDRAHTVRTAVAAGARPEDLRQPGHVFPLMARPGGVLTRAGHTEAGCDLARLAGFEPAAVIVEILNDDGTMARRPDLERFAAAHGLRIGTIADLIRYRLENESSIERIADRAVETEFGTFRLCGYRDRVHGALHVALVRGEAGGSPPLVRV